MTVEDAKCMGGCLVQVSKRDYNFGGRVFFLFRYYHEYIVDGTVNYGCILQNPFNENEYVDIKPSWLEVIPYKYPDPKNEIIQSELKMKEIEELGGKLVEYEGRPVYLRRLCKEYDEDRHWHYMLYLQEYEYPNTMFEASVSDIRRYSGEQPATVRKEVPPIVQREHERKAAEAAEEEIIRKSQEEVLAFFKQNAGCYK